MCRFNSSGQVISLAWTRSDFHTGNTDAEPKGPRPRGGVAINSLSSASWTALHILDGLHSLCPGPARRAPARDTSSITDLDTRAISKVDRVGPYGVSVGCSCRRTKSWSLGRLRTRTSAEPRGAALSAPGEESAGVAARSPGPEVGSGASSCGARGATDGYPITGGAAS